MRCQLNAPPGVKAREEDALGNEPRTAYSVWFNAHRQEIQKQLCSKGVKNLSGKALARKGLEIWKALPETDKKKYEEKYTRETETCEDYLKTVGGATMLLE